MGEMAKENKAVREYVNRRNRFEFAAKARGRKRVGIGRGGGAVGDEENEVCTSYRLLIMNT
ncbi:unnamed protein product [Haemonchus placei]|uniref:Uncharacterized protein n=1 Tax=Haemonchus placei TaxID=6290 RepID=A0A0N4WHA1_HAEPC|nr:unnamed protein product [Haemonchus placei]